MRMTKTDLNILVELKKELAGLSCHSISRRTGRDPSQVHKRLKKLAVHGILLKIISKPCIYRINFGKKKEAGFITVACPKCSTEHFVHNEQLTVTCRNNDCTTSSGNKTRFYIFNRRIQDFKNVLE